MVVDTLQNVNLTVYDPVFCDSNWEKHYYYKSAVCAGTCYESFDFLV